MTGFNMTSLGMALHECIDLRMYVTICAFVSVDLWDVYLDVCVHVYMQVCQSVCLSVCLYLWIFCEVLCGCIHAWCLCMCILIYVRMYTHTQSQGGERETQRERERESEREREKDYTMTAVSLATLRESSQRRSNGFCPVIVRAACLRSRLHPSLLGAGRH